MVVWALVFMIISFALMLANWFFNVTVSPVIYAYFPIVVLLGTVGVLYNALKTRQKYAKYEEEIKELRSKQKSE